MEVCTLGSSDYIVREPKRSFEKSLGNTIRFALEKALSWEGGD